MNIMYSLVSGRMR